jgi:tRNA-Thr(GGU) m(6)t(6)A37 methyltransferase TsaA
MAWDDQIVVEPIGVIRSPFTTVAGTPLQSVAAGHVSGSVEIRPDLAPGLRDLDGFSHLHLLTWLHHSPPASRLELVPFLDDTPRGIFATRSPERPNPIGLSVVRLLKVEGAKLWVSGLDLLDGTPVLDIKPYVPDFDLFEPERFGWLERRAADVHRVVSDERFLRS